MGMKIVILVVAALIVRAFGDGNTYSSINARYKASHIPALFSFGDSVSDAGTNNYLPAPAYLANFTPYGESYFPKPTGRFSDGRLWIDFIAQDLGLPLMKPFLQPENENYDHGVNFASAGAGFLKSTRLGHVVSLPEQFKQFKKVKTVLEEQRGMNSTKTLLSRSLYFINAGSNDFFAGYLTNETLLATVTPLAFTLTVTRQLEKLVKDLFREGGRKIIVGEQSPLGCLPAIRATTVDGNCSADVNGLAQLFNAELPDLRSRLTQKHPGLFMIIVKSYDILDEYINNGTHGFTKGSHACCGAGSFNGEVQCGIKDSQGNNNYTLCADSELSEYVFWDQFHPNQKTYELLSKAWLTGDSTCAFPFNIHSLVDC